MTGASPNFFADYRREISRLLVGLFLGAALAVAPPAWAEEPLIVGETAPLHVETPHPYPVGDEAGSVVWRHGLR
ncbi:MAG: hypothetical protein JSV80_04300, partial [Acidobacteriota bacterium]